MSEADGKKEEEFEKRRARASVGQAGILRHVFRSLSRIVNAVAILATKAWAMAHNPLAPRPRMKKATAEEGDRRDRRARSLTSSARSR
jgi:hypothetical protein